MTGREEVDMEQLMKAIAADVQLLHTIQRRLPGRVATALASGVSGRHLARVANMSEPTVRRMKRRATKASGPEPAISPAGQGLDLNLTYPGETHVQSYEPPTC